MSATPKFHAYNFYRSSNGKVFKCIGVAGKKYLSAALVSYNFKDERSFTFSKKSYYFDCSTGDHRADFAFHYYGQWAEEVKYEGTLQLPALTEEQVQAVFLPWRAVRAESRPLILD